MCGITGYYSFNRNFSQDDLKLMSDSLSHRGPDADGFFNDEVCGLGHRRLSIIDLSASANQPMFSHSARYIIVFNGEIYNYKEIANELNITFKTTSDTEVLLEAFEKWGVDFVHHLNGMFAIAIFDKTEKRLFLFRDRLGIKPIYYYWKNNDFLFSSELKAITTIDKVKKSLSINRTAVNEFFNLGYIPEPHSIYSEISKFPSGSHAIIDKNGIKIEKYWDLNSKIKSESINNFQDVKSELKELLESSVKYRLISDVPFGTFLSGGIDSSLITAIASKVSSEKLNTFTIRFDDAKYNEADYAKKIAEYLGTNHHEFTVTYNDAKQLVDEITSVYDEPYADSSAIPTMLVSKLARQHVTMTLSGDGGDELFHGYGAYNWANRLNNPLVSTFRKPISNLMSLMNDKYKRAGKVFDYKDVSKIKSHIFSQEQYFFSNNELSELLTKEYQTEICYNENFENIKRTLTPSESQALFDINYYLKDDLLVKVDRASMKYSLETRVPFLDYRIVEFASNISHELKMKNGVQKYISKELLYDYIPKEFFDRPKWGFAIPLKNWLKDDLRFLIENELSDSRIIEDGILNLKYIQKLKSDFFNGQSHLYNRLWACVVFNKWYAKNKPQRH